MCHSVFAQWEKCEEGERERQSERQRQRQRQAKRKGHDQVQSGHLTAMYASLQVVGATEEVREKGQPVS